MKINEKNLINFAVSKTPIDREGWLYKRGEVNKNYQKRWFILKGNLLFYFDRKEDKEPIGVIILEGCSIELTENEERYAFKLVFHGAGNRTYYFSASDQDEMEDWMKSIASASYDYMKLMVAELQRQLDEIIQQEEQHHNELKNCGVMRSSDLGQKDFQSMRPSVFKHTDIAPRRNPFDTSNVHNVNGGHSSTTFVDDTTVLEAEQLSNDQKQKSGKQKYIFLEMHEYYGQIFRRYLEESKKQSSSEQLINFE